MADKKTGREARVTRGVHRNENVVFIELTQGYRAIVDADTWPRIARDYGARWVANHRAQNSYVYARKMQSDGAGGKRYVTLARAVMRALPGERVEVLNGDTLDCRRSNLDLLETEAAKKRQRQYAEKRAAHREAQYLAARAKHDRKSGGPERRRRAREFRRDWYLPADKLAQCFKASSNGSQ